MTTLRTYAIGDIHGHLDKLKETHAWIMADRARVNDYDSPLIHLGDMIDRGPDSRGVVQYLMDGMAAGEPWMVVKGNHDRYLTKFIDEMRVDDSAVKSGLMWFHPRLGGAETLASYGVTAIDGAPLEPIHAAAKSAVPDEHLDFIRNLPLFHERGEVLYVHAGIRPGVPMSQQTEHDLIWIREGFLNDATDHGPLIVHGHTALNLPLHYGNRVDLDAGAGYGAPITAAVIEGRNVEILTANGRRDIDHSLPPVTLPDPNAYSGPIPGAK